VGETPDQIRRDIEQTRGRMTDTVEEIGYRADVKTRTKEKIMGAKDSVLGTAQGATQRLTAPLQSREDAPSSVSGQPRPSQTPAPRLPGASPTHYLTVSRCAR
jgi:uncharacterized protein DUF3618